MEARRRLVGDFVSARLGFPSADLRDMLLSVAHELESTLEPNSPALACEL